MIKLICKDDDKAVFYFKDIEDCNTFMHVFKDHWCNVEWEHPIEAKSFSMSAIQKSKMRNDPKERAESNLSWGFNLCKQLNKDLTDTQRSFIDNMITKEHSSTELSCICDSCTHQQTCRLTGQYKTIYEEIIKDFNESHTEGFRLNLQCNYWEYKFPKSIN